MGSSSSKPLQEPLNVGRRNPAIVRPSTAITERDRAVLDLKIQRDRLKQYQKKLLIIIERENEIAKLQLRRGNRDRALLALRKKKYQQNLLNNTFSQLLTVEELTMSIEFTQVQQDVIEGLKGGNEILNTIQKELKLEDVEQLMADTSEAIRYQNSISDALAGLLTDAEEDDLQSELDQILLEKMPTLSDLKLPAVALKKEVDNVFVVADVDAVDKDDDSLVNINNENNNEDEQESEDEEDQEELVNY